MQLWLVWNSMQTRLTLSSWRSAYLLLPTAGVCYHIRFNVVLQLVILSFFLIFILFFAVLRLNPEPCTCLTTMLFLHLCFCLLFSFLWCQWQNPGTYACCASSLPLPCCPQPWFFLGLCAYDGYCQLIPRCFTEWLITSLAGVLLECLLFDFLIMRLTTNKPTIISFVEHKFNQCSTSLLLKIWEFCKVYTSSSIEKLQKQKLHTKVFLKLAFFISICYI